MAKGKRGFLGAGVYIFIAWDVQSVHPALVKILKKIMGDKRDAAGQDAKIISFPTVTQMDNQILFLFWNLESFLHYVEK